jgi:7-keto-8-aminopelargonate synthetase-like enzyme
MLLYLDDAHGTGVLGNGRGALSHFSIEPEPWIIQMGTFSKALGSFGAFITGDPEITAWLINTARGLIYSTALPPCVVAASICSMQCLMQDQSLILQLWSNREKLFSGLKELGFNTLTSETPILPVAPPYPELQRQLRSQSQEIEATLRLSELLQENRIYAPAIRPPTVTTPRIRLAVSAVHTDADIETLLSAMKSLSAVRNL